MITYSGQLGRGVRLQYVYGTDLSSWAIGAFSADKLSHVDAVLPDDLCEKLTRVRKRRFELGSLMGARLDRIGGAPRGVQIRPPFYEQWRRRVLIETPATDAQVRSFWNFMLSQEGRPYDWRAIAAFALDRDWREEDSWFCSELVTRAQEVAKIVKGLFLQVYKVTPVASALIQSAIGGVLLFDSQISVRQLGDSKKA